MMSITKLSLPGPVLVVDDDEKFRDSLTSFLEEQGLQVISVPSAVHACKHMQNQTWTWFPSMIITDIVMDGMGGFEFIRRVQEMYQKRKIPIIVVSKLKGKIDVIEAESAGAIAYVLKPAKPEHVFNVMCEIFHAKKKRMHLVMPLKQADI